MAALTPPLCNFDWPAPEFTLPATDGQSYALSDISGPNGTLIMFICNHCPFVLAILDRMIRDAAELLGMGIGVAAICSNDSVSYPADSFANMARLAEQHAFPFPYLHDADQSVARAYDAVCTPDFFGFNAQMGLQYRGQLDASRMQPAPLGARRDLFEAMVQVARTGHGPEAQIPAMGCSIKWA